MRNKILPLVLFIIIVSNFLLAPGFTNSQTNQKEIPPSLMLIGAGARWAAKEKRGIALYVNWQDNLYLHPNPLKPTPPSFNPGDSISYILENCGFKVKFAGDIPNDLTPYSVIVLTAYWAVEPKHEPIIRDYLSKGGGLVLISGIPCYFICYCKDFWPYRCGGKDLKIIQDWFGAGWYLNTGGDAILIIDNPFGTSLKKGDFLIIGEDFASAAVAELQPGAEVIAKWEDGNIFSFKYEKFGRVYYQASYEKLITKMTIPELETNISKVTTKITELISEAIQIIKEKIAEIQAKIIELEEELKAQQLRE